MRKTLISTICSRSPGVRLASHLSKSCAPNLLIRVECAPELSHELQWSRDLGGVRMIVSGPHSAAARLSSRCLLRRPTPLQGTSAAPLHGSMKSDQRYSPSSRQTSVSGMRPARGRLCHAVSFIRQNAWLCLGQSHTLRIWLSLPFHN